MVQVRLPSGLALIDATPVGWSENNGRVTWSSQSMVAEQGHEYVLTVQSCDVFDNYLEVVLIEDPQVGRTDGGTAIARIIVTGSSAQVQQGMSAEGFDEEHVTETFASESLETTLAVYPMPELQAATAVTVTLTNRTGSSVTYRALIDLPNGWEFADQQGGTSRDWQETLLAYQAVEYSYPVASGNGEGDWTLDLTLQQLQGPSHSISYMGSASTGGHTMFHGATVTRGGCCWPTLSGCSGYSQSQCQGCAFTLTGALKYEWGAGDARVDPSIDTLVRLYVIPTGGVTPCSGFIAERFTNTDSNGDFQFSNIQFVPGFYFVMAYATDAQSVTGAMFDTWVVASGCPDVDVPCTALRYNKRIWDNIVSQCPGSVLNIGESIIPRRPPPPITSINPPGDAFRAQTLVTTRSAPLVDDCFTTFQYDHWVRATGAYRTRICLPYEGGSVYRETGNWGGRIYEYRDFYEGALHHEYGHHVLGVHYRPGNGIDQFGSALSEGWANYYEDQLMGSADGSYAWSTECMDEPRDAQSNSSSSIHVELALNDVADGSNECFDSMSGEKALLYHVIVDSEPDNMCECIQHWHGGSYPHFDSALPIWQYNGFNPYGGNPIPGCP